MVFAIETCYLFLNCCIRASITNWNLTCNKSDEDGFDHCTNKLLFDQLIVYSLIVTINLTQSQQCWAWPDSVPACLFTMTMFTMILDSFMHRSFVLKMICFICRLNWQRSQGYLISSWTVHLPGTWVWTSVEIRRICMLSVTEPNQREMDYGIPGLWEC